MQKQKDKLMFDIQENLKKLPEKPGVYIHKDQLGQVIYVGKAVSLRRRVRQYFQSQKNMAPKVKAMVSHIAEFEYITTDSEMEALILECNLIKRYRPPYNILLRDDKTYPYIKVTLQEDFPRLVKTRRVLNDGAKYFGPYSDVGAVNEMIDLLNSVYTLKRCSARSFPQNFRPCLNYHIEQCKGICTGLVDRAEYRKSVEEVMNFLKGRTDDLIKNLEKKMYEASEALDFERAAMYRDKINDARTISEGQKIDLGSAGDMDIILTAKGANVFHIILFYVRGSKLSGRDSFQMEAEEGDSRAELISSFMKQYYTEEMLIPKEIAVEYEPDDLELLQEWLSSMRGSGVHVYLPQRGEKRALMDMARRDVLEMMKVLDEKAQAREERINAVASEMNRLFGKQRELVYSRAAKEAVQTGELRASADTEDRDGRCSWRIESYDISNIGNVDAVGGMVVFENGKPQRRDYRKFRIRTVEGQDDYSSMQEVIYRRFRRAEEGDPGFNRRPDVIFVDGGLGHVHAVSEVLEAMNEHVIVAGMVKDDRHRTRGLIVDGREIDLKENPVMFRYVTTIQDEVHRFAIGYHHDLRNKSMSKSVLDDAPGIGPKRKAALLREFGSIDRIREADQEALARVDGMNMKAAEDLLFYLKKMKKDAERRDGTGED